MCAPPAIFRHPRITTHLPLLRTPSSPPTPSAQAKPHPIPQGPPANVNALLLRDADTDATYNVTAALDTSGNVVQRVVYNAYGEAAFKNAAYNATGNVAALVVLFQGMYRDFAINLDFTQSRQYSWTLDTFTSADPTGYPDGLNNMAFVADNPINETDASGLQGSGGVNGARISPEDAERYTDFMEVKTWRAQGNNFAADLLEAFLAKKYNQTRDAGYDFEKYADEIKTSPEFRSAAQLYFSTTLPHNHSPSTFSLPDVPKPFDTPAFVANYHSNVGYLLNNAPDLAVALGGAHFGYKDLVVTITGCHWKVSGTFIQEDQYVWQNKEIQNNFYAAAYDLQQNHDYHWFYHRESWHDEFEGNIINNVGGGRR